jgi:endoglucanase
MRKRLVSLAAFLLLCALTAEAQHSVVLAWTASTDTGSTYDIYRLSGACPTGTPSGFTLLNTAPITGTTYTDSTVTPGTYCYYATAVLGGQQSVPSNTVSVVILPAPPQGLKVNSSQ